MRWLALCILILGTAGCGAETFETAAVWGVVDLPEGSLEDADFIIVRFEPLDIAPVGGKMPPVASGRVQPDGVFDLRALSLDGVPVGTYCVKLTVVEEYAKSPVRSYDLGTAEVKPGVNAIELQFDPPPPQRSVAAVH